MKIDTLDNINNSQWATIKDFVSLKKQEKLVKEQLSVLSPDVTSWLEEMLSGTDEKTVELPSGDKLTLVIGKDWEYPKYIEEEVKTLKKKVTELQKVYQIKNQDKWTPSEPSVRFKDGGEK